MKMESALNIGDTGWCVNIGITYWENANIKSIKALTIGFIRIEKIDSPGIGNSIFDNYKPQKGYKEEYMCVETGISSGNLYTLGCNIFTSEKEAIEALEKKKKEKHINRI